MFSKLDLACRQDLMALAGNAFSGHVVAACILAMMAVGQWYQILEGACRSEEEEGQVEQGLDEDTEPEVISVGSFYLDPQ